MNESPTDLPEDTSKMRDPAQSAEIQVLCSCDEPYLPHTATMLCSLLEHNDVSRIHLFYISIAGEELAKLSSLAARYGSELVGHRMMPENLQDFRLHKPYWSVANYFRLLAPRILPADLDKILYLDSDIIVRRSLRELWSTDISDHAFGAVEDAFWDRKLDYFEVPPGAKYFNSGVLLINLDFWRRNKVYERAVEFIRDNPEKVNYYDQDALNATLVDSWISLSAIWNDHARSKLHVPAVRNKNILDPAIVHFVGPFKPWDWACEHPFKREYHQHRRKTPWPLYRLDGQPPLLKRFARAVLPATIRRWLRARVFTKPN
jgi:lipopolysaccharide biosynthesis glycosyltransferase